MDEYEKKILTDILMCIETIEAYLGENKIFETYDSNLILQDAVERNLITIGEAMNTLLKKSPLIDITNARKAVSVRNRLTQGYDDIENLQIWNILIKHLPLMKSEVEKLLNT